MSWIDSLKNLLTFKRDVIQQLQEENDSLKDSIVACRLALRSCEENNFSLEGDITRYQLEVDRLDQRAINREQSPEGYYALARILVGNVPLFETYWGIVVEELKALGIAWMANSAPDSKIFYTDESTMIKIIPFLTYPADFAVESLSLDCDDYALWATADASRIFRLTTVFQAWGDFGGSYHAFCICKVAEGQYRIFEPNSGFEVAGELFKIGEHSYFPQRWK